MKGLSFEEKCKRLLELFYETSDFFQLKELEKIAPKQKGIVMQSVKEVLQALVDDNLVQGEKIGTSNYFWSFPSSARHLRTTKLETLREQISRIDNQLKDLDKEIGVAKVGKDQSETRTVKLNELLILENEKKRIEKELDSFKELDPEAFEKNKQNSENLSQKINTWTDNIYALQSYCSKTFNIDGVSFLKQFEIPDDLEYL
ncbi:meiotic nuclear division protein 1 [Rozella allomycis CSF55]|uniref:Meiotic nuclear division protein 1 n=1 Tax=Rozella allomycis (strain CSF55) TaxID=988480 RepID=A0A075B0C8_ROZAC|nr:Meiotic nuclear division protein 1 domain-containing protein [Rozella allomycis CSF55]RKP22109.1 meiotic nuclear division protein 1 [Rozella allomycis CSF55]|eukprot:EPZ35975.1 Meiotic nuclear division protein 1 domain-containing protein [Rozella allomycis CSF55]